MLNGPQQLTLGRCFTQQTLESSASINKLHIRRHIRLAAATSNRPHCPEIDNRRLNLTFADSCEWRNDQRKWYGRLLHNVQGAGNVVHGGANKFRTGIALVVGDELGGDQRRNETRLVCDKWSGDGSLVFGHHLEQENLYLFCELEMFVT